eukprot:4872588-Prymnesium_polylepis.1
MLLRETTSRIREVGSQRVPAPIKCSPPSDRKQHGSSVRRRRSPRAPCGFFVCLWSQVRRHRRLTTAARGGVWRPR